MEETEKIRIAKWAIMKDLDYEALYYSDEMYGREKDTDEVFEYVTECKEIGTTAFYKKYGN